MSTLTHHDSIIKHIITGAATARTVWLLEPDSLNGATVRVQNGHTASYSLDAEELDVLLAYFRQAAGWTLQPCVSSDGYTARRTKCQTCHGTGHYNGTTEFGTLTLMHCPVCTPIPFDGSHVDYAPERTSAEWYGV